MIELQDYEIRCIEEEILNVFNDNWSKYPECDCLLTVRKDIINKRALAHQEEILPDIIAFNDALTAALRDFDAGFLRTVSDEQLIERWRIVLVAILVGFPQFIFTLIGLVILSVDFA